MIIDIDYTTGVSIEGGLPILEQLKVAATLGVTDWSHFGHIVGRDHGDLVILNYTQGAMVERTWNEAECLCRGLILDRRTGEVVARPFDKFFNWGEGGRTTDAPIRWVTEKLDGSLGIIYHHEDAWHVATRGSFASDQAIWAQSWLQSHCDTGTLDPNETYLVEIIYPENKVVMNYGDRRGLALLAVRNRHTGEYACPLELPVIAQYAGFQLAIRHYITTVEGLAQVAERMPISDGEGFVAEFADGQRFKFKSTEYKTLHKLVCGLTPKRVWEAMAQGTLDELFGVIPDEFLEEARDWAEAIQAHWIAVVADVAEAAAFPSPGEWGRKEKAVFILNHPRFSRVAPYIFAHMDGKDFEPIFYRREYENWVPGR